MPKTNLMKDIKLEDVQQWYANKINKQVSELDSYDLFCAKVAYDYACECLPPSTNTPNVVVNKGIISL